ALRRDSPRPAVCCAGRDRFAGYGASGQRQCCSRGLEAKQPGRNRGCEEAAGHRAVYVHRSITKAGECCSVTVKVTFKKVAPRSGLFIAACTTPPCGAA